EEAEMLCRHIGIIQRGELIENTSMRNLLAKLQYETFILDTDHKQDVITLAGYQVIQREEGRIEVTVQRDQGLNGLFIQLSKQQINVLSMRNKANRLEELFVELVHEGPKTHA